jgi:hypothetical protein
MSKSTGDNTKTRKKRPDQAGTLVGTRLQSDELSKLDKWRRGQNDLPSRPEAIRRILADYFK